MSQGEMSLAGTRCLVLDDEFLIALDIQNILESAGAASVICVANAGDALAAINDGLAFDLAVLDLRLSDAAATSTSVASALIKRRTPFVFLTGVHGDDPNLKEFPRTPVVEKPYQTALLLQAISRALSAR